MVFLPGEHNLDTNITVANVASLTMRGKFSSGNIAIVVRNGSVGFSFTNMVDFNIYSLAFTSNNRSLSYDSHPASNSALLLRSTQNTKLVNCSFHDNLGTALVVINSGITLVGNSKFIHNQCACQSFSEVHGYGCGIAALNSNLTLTGNTSFYDNTQASSSDTLSCAGAIWASASSLHFNGTNNFIGNSANQSSGGAICAVTNTKLSFIGTSDFGYNSADRYGGAIEAFDNVKITFNGTNNFVNNFVQQFGGAIHAQSITVHFIGTSNFSQNLAGRYGGGINAYNNTILSFNGINNFINNSANNDGGGAIYAGMSTSLSFIGTSNFHQNSAHSFGGAIEAFVNIVLTFNGTNNFINNSASENGGGAIYAGSNTSLSLIETSYFSHNSASSNGGAIEAYGNVVVTLNGNNNFTNNSANSGGTLYAELNASLIFNGTSSFSNNSAVQGGAIFVDESTTTFSGNISFVNNGHNTEDSRGGAVYFYISSTLSILPNTTVCLENNHANLGGAIYVYDVNPSIYCTHITRYIPKPKCFFQLPGQNLHRGLDVQLVFKNNSADTAGSALYGGVVDNCKLAGLDSNSSGEVFDMLVRNEDDTDYSTTSKISSHPFRICPCENNIPDCSKSNTVLSVYRGESYQVSVAAVGQREGIVPTNVMSANECNLLCSQTVQKTSKTCTTLYYTVSSQKNVTLELYADGHCSTFGDKLVLQLNGTKDCPVILGNHSINCICDQAHKKYGIELCTITKGESVQITRSANETFWVGYNQSDGLVFHPRCPFDYCVNHIVHFTLDNIDMQCAYNRSGLLCGACNEGYSLGLGTFQCMECSNDNNLALLVPFALMGVALVFLLLVCKLTVATGTISGLVFYANIVGDNRTIFLPVKSPTLSVFIAWLNLDFGIETCFYDGMDAYSKTWLQFVFPVYLWVLVGLMILVSHFSQRFANLLGNNPVSILSTLIFLSYAKIVRTLITALSFTDLEYSHYPRTVWLYDANLDYVQGKHIPLFLVAAIVFLFLFLPYTLLLLFGQWLQGMSHLRLFSWVNSPRLKPFIDSYHAPYKQKHRYWPGLLLVLRFVLLLVFAFNFQRDPSINMLAILVGTGMLTIWAWVSGGVYKNWCIDALEGSFMLNLILLGVATYHIKLSGGNQLAVGYTSVSIALASFIGILAYHIFQQLRHTKLWNKASKLNSEFKTLKKLNTQEEYNPNNLDSIVFGRFDRLRESLLDDLPQPTHSVV